MDLDPTIPRKPPIYYPRSDDLCSHTEHVTVKNVLFGFKAFTTAHGVPHVDQARGLCKRVWWTLLTLTCIAVLLLQIYLITATYTSSPVTPIVVKQSSRTLTFPAVTVCNTNPVKSSALHLSPTLSGLVDGWEEGKRRRRRGVEGEEWAELGGDRNTQEGSVDNHNAKEDALPKQSSVDSHINQVKPLAKENVKIQEVTAENLKYQKSIVYNHVRQKKLGSIENQTTLESTVSDWDSATSETSREVGDQGTTKYENKLIPDARTRQVHTNWNSVASGTSEDADVTQTTETIDSTGEWVSDARTRQAQSNVYSVTSGREVDDTVRPDYEYTETTDVMAPSASLSNTSSSEHVIIKRQISGIRHFCTVVYPYGTYCLIDALTPAEDSGYLCEGLGPGYTLASLDTQDKAIKVEQSYFFGITLHSHTYLIGLSGSAWSGLSWLSGDIYSYNQWRDGILTNGTFSYTQVAIKTSQSHVWEPAQDLDEGLPLCHVNSYSEVTTPTPYYETSSTTVETTVTTTEPPTTTTLPTTTTTEPSSFPDREPVREDFQKTNDFLEALADLPQDVKVELGYQPAEFILGCVYDGQECDESEFGHFFDTSHGNCYSFNSGWLGEDLSPARKPGRSSGLSLTLNIGQYDYMPGISEIAGVVVVVHSQARMPFPEDEGVLGHAGQVTSIGISQVSVDRLGGKYSDCLEEDKDPIRNVFEEHHHVNYSSAGCHKTCYQRHLIERCGCYDPQYPGTGTALGSAVVPVCDTRNRQQDDCMYGVLLDFIANDLACDCPIKCDEDLYTHSISRARWPSAVYKDSLIAKHADKLTRLLNYSTEESYLYRNLLKIEVYFDELNFEYVYEKPKYPISLYMADLASLLGLWLGLSVLSIAEGLELVADLIVVSLKKILKLDKPKIREFSSISLKVATNGRPPERSSVVPGDFQWSTLSRTSYPGSLTEASPSPVDQARPNNMLTNYAQMLVLGKFKRAANKNKIWNSYF